MRLVRDCGPLAERARTNRKADAEGWALGLQRTLVFRRASPSTTPWFMVAGTAGALDARDGDDGAMIDAITLAVVAGCQGPGPAVRRTPSVQDDPSRSADGWVAQPVK